MSVNDFGFGIETEFLMVDKETFAPLSHRHLDFDQLTQLIDTVPTSDFGDYGFNIKPHHTKATPYLIEGYYLSAENDINKKVSLLPKGIEIRTPISNNIQACIAALQELFARLQVGSRKIGYDLAVVSHHPTESNFHAPPNYVRHDYWQWALTAMTTFGPDINISVPDEIAVDVIREKVQARINYYMPSIIAMTLNSPLSKGALWHARGRVGKSLRTYRRSIWAPLFYVHDDPALRFEFKGFEMARCLEDYNVFFLLSLALLLDDALFEQSAEETKIYELGQIAVYGLEAEHTRKVASQVLRAAERMAERFGLSRDGMDAFWNRLDSKRLPADDIIELFNEYKGSIPAVMSKLIGFYSRHAKESGEKIPCA